jgi:hypothetical protein
VEDVEASEAEDQGREGFIRRRRRLWVMKDMATAYSHRPMTLKLRNSY